VTKWPQVPVGDVLHLVRRPVTLDPDRRYVEIGVRSFGKGIFHKPPVTGVDLGNKRIFEIGDSELVINIVFAWEGAVAISGRDEKGKIGSHRFLTFQGDPDRVDLSFVKAFLISEWGRGKLLAASPGSAGRNRTLARNGFERLMIPLPPLDEQRRVVNYFSRVEELIARTRARTRARSAVEAAVILRTHISRLFEHQRGLQKVGDLAQIENLLVRPGDDLGGAQAFVGLEHIAGHFGTRIGAAPVGGELGRKFHFSAGDVLYGYLRPYQNKVWLADRVGLCSVEQFVLRTRDPRDAELLWFALRGQGVLDQVTDMTNNLQLPRLASGKLMDITLKWPDAKARGTLLDNLRRVQAATFRLAEATRTEEKLVAALGSSILNEVFSGQV